MNKSRTIIYQTCKYISLILTITFVAFLVSMTSNIDRYVVRIVENIKLCTDFEDAMVILSLIFVYLILCIVFNLIMFSVYNKLTKFSLLKQTYFSSRLNNLVLVQAFCGGIIVSVIFWIYYLVSKKGKKSKQAAPSDMLDDSLKLMANKIEMLRKEYFMGNITKEEYHQILSSILSNK